MLVDFSVGRSSDARTFLRWRRAVVAGTAASAVLLLGVTALRLAAPWYVERRVVAALARAGYPGATVEVDRVGWTETVIASISLSPEARASGVIINYDPWRLLFDGSVDLLRVERVDLAVRLTEDRAPSLPELRDSLPITTVEIAEARVRIVSAETDVEMTGTLTVSQDAWAVHVHGTSALGDAALLAAGEGNRFAWRVSGALGPEGAARLRRAGVAIEEGRFAASGHTSLAAGVARRATLRGTVALHAARARAEDIDVAGLALELAPRIELESGAVRLELEHPGDLRADGLVVGGAAVGSLQASLDVRGAIAKGASWATGRVDAAWPRLAVPGTPCVLRDLALRAPFTLGASPPPPPAELEAAVQWSGRRVGALSLQLEREGGGVALRGSFGSSGGVRLGLQGRLAGGVRELRGSLAVRMAERSIDLGAVATRWAGRRKLRGTARVAVDGRVELGGHVPKVRWTARVRGGAIQIGELRLEGVEADLARASPAPSRTEPLAIAFEHGRAGPLELDDGRVLLYLGPVPAASIRASALGGSLSTSALSLSRVRDARVDVALRGAELRRVLPVLGVERLSGTGRIDATAAVDVGPGWPAQLQLRRAHLSSVAGGQLAVRDRELAARLAGFAAGDDITGQARQRIATALTDFTYSRLSIDLAPQGGQLHLAVTARGKGRRVAQELSLSLRARGFDRLLARALDLRRPLAVHLARSNH